MKRILVIIVVAIVALQGMAQESQLNALFDKYSGQEGYTSVYITSYMFELFSKIADEDDFDNVTQGLVAIKILTASGSSSQKKAFFTEVNKALPSSVYKDFMIVKDGGQEIVFKVRDDGKKISEFVI